MSSRAERHRRRECRADRRRHRQKKGKRGRGQQAHRGKEAVGEGLEALYRLYEKRPGAAAAKAYRKAEEKAAAKRRKARARA